MNANLAGDEIPPITPLKTTLFNSLEGKIDDDGFKQ